MVYIKRIVDSMLKWYKCDFVKSFAITLYIFLPQVILFKSIKYMAAVIVSMLVVVSLRALGVWLYSLVALYCLAFNAVVLHIYYHWGNVAITSRIQAAMLAPPTEASGYIKAYVGLFEVGVLAYLIVGVVMLFRARVSECSLRVRDRVRVGIAMTAMFYGLNAFGLDKYIVPVYYTRAVWDASQWKAIADSRARYINNIKESLLVKDDAPIRYEKVVIVIGESVNRKHMSCYGYHLDTTPFLQALISGEGKVVDNVISPTNQTRFSVPIMMTDATVSDFSKFARSSSLVMRLNGMGYKTYWLSNQYESGVQDTYIRTIGDEAGYSRYANFVYYLGGVRPHTDEVLLKFVEDINLEEGVRQAFIFHLLGSHFFYHDRYPGDWAVIGGSNGVVGEYDTSINYTDSVLSRIWERFSRFDTLFVYVADHGEVVSDGVSGHGFYPGYKDEYEVPLVVAGRANDPRINELVAAGDNGMINLEGFVDIVKYLADPRVTQLRLSESRKVISLDPKNVFDYDALKYFSSSQNSVEPQ